MGSIGAGPQPHSVPTSTMPGRVTTLFREWGRAPRSAPLSSPAEDWAQRAACRGQTALFFPSHAERPEARKPREARARALCATCPVLEECRALGRQRREYGFWGGETEEERAAAGYPVALPVGQVAQRIRILRQAALAAGGG